MNPYDKLYIYEIEGEVSQRSEETPADYIGTWWEGDHSFLFFSQKREEVIRSILKCDPSLRLIDRFTMNYHDWQGGDELGPFRVGKMVFIPPWENVTVRADELPILLDPSVVFGTGLHPTTRGCLEALWKLYQKDTPQSVLDLGTGTGILALACAKLGAERILAVDYNPLAVQTTTRNVNLNGEERRIDVVRGKAEDLVAERGNLICCNLHFEVLDRLMGIEAFFQKRWTILSGFFESEGKVIIQKLRRRGIDVDVLPTQDPWQTFVGLNPSR